MPAPPFCLGASRLVVSARALDFTPPPHRSIAPIRATHQHSSTDDVLASLLLAPQLRLVDFTCASTSTATLATSELILFPLLLRGD
mmetsp:Transcript_216/g.587  ORF Transcript_216/g.587 Transcript_216/m.587 type:complete len:86 (+) Transcript_216:898-1155(+)